MVSSQQQTTHTALNHPKFWFSRCHQTLGANIDCSVCPVNISPFPFKYFVFLWYVMYMWMLWKLKTTPWRENHWLVKKKKKKKKKSHTWDRFEMSLIIWPDEQDFHIEWISMQLPCSVSISMYWLASNLVEKSRVWTLKCLQKCLQRSCTHCKSLTKYAPITIEQVHPAHASHIQTCPPFSAFCCWCGPGSPKWK